jgi:hypothetical protein
VSRPEFQPSRGSEYTEQPDEQQDVQQSEQDYQGDALRQVVISRSMGEARQLADQTAADEGTEPTEPIDSDTAVRSIGTQAIRLAGLMSEAHRDKL